MPFLYCFSAVLCFTANATLLNQLNDEFYGVWISCGLRHRFRCGYDGFGFYDHSDIMTKMVWSQSGHINRRLLYYHSSYNNAQMLDTALLISNRKGLMDFLNALTKESFYDRLSRPDTKWKIVQISSSMPTI